MRFARRHGMHGAAVRPRPGRGNAGSGRRDRRASIPAHRPAAGPPARPARDPAGDSQAAPAHRLFLPEGHHHAPPFRIPQDRRGVRPPVHVLHHPRYPGRPAEPHRRFARGRGPSAGRPGRRRAEPDLAGHHLVRQGPAGTGPVGRPAHRAERRGGRALDPGAVQSPRAVHRQADPCLRRPGTGLRLHRHAAAAHIGPHARPHEPRDDLEGDARAAEADPRPDAGRDAEDHLHRGLSGRDRRGFRTALRLRGRDAVRSHGRVHVFAGGADTGRPVRRTDRRARQAGAARPAHGAATRDITRTQPVLRGEDGRRADRRTRRRRALHGRTAADAPEVDNEVLVTGEGLAPGDFASVDITDAMEYDLVGAASTGVSVPGGPNSQQGPNSQAGPNSQRGPNPQTFPAQFGTPE